MEIEDVVPGAIYIENYYYVNSKKTSSDDKLFLVLSLKLSSQTVFVLCLNDYKIYNKLLRPWSSQCDKLLTSRDK